MFFQRRGVAFVSGHHGVWRTLAPPPPSERRSKDKGQCEKEQDADDFAAEGFSGVSALSDGGERPLGQWEHVLYIGRCLGELGGHWTGFAAFIGRAFINIHQRGVHEKDIG